MVTGFLLKSKYVFRLLSWWVSTSNYFSNRKTLNFKHQCRLQSCYHTHMNVDVKWNKKTNFLLYKVLCVS